MKKFVLKLFTLTFLLFVFQTCNEPFESANGPLWDTPPGIEIAIEQVQDVIDLQDKVSDALFNNPQVVGHGVGMDENGNPAIKVYTLGKVIQRSDVTVNTIGKGDHPLALPISINNVPIIPVVSGMFKAFVDPTARFSRPVPIGVSTGHSDITAGTIGCRVKDGTNTYALSNNHVFANSNKASIGDNILQPGPYDGGSDPADAIGTLQDYEPIDFSGNNIMDAAIALCTAGTLGSATPDGAGYGTPGTTTATASVGLAVQKYGRTTGHTHGAVDAINATVDVCYESKGPFRCVQLARFVGQIVVTPGTFSGGGDSGSLIVTENGNNPVALLFAGSSSHTIGSPIGPILSRFGVTIDDGSGGGTPPTNNQPNASFTFSVSGKTVTFTDKSSDPDSGDAITNWSWDFGDDNTSTIQNPVHIYAANGTYRVTLTVTDGGGLTDTFSDDVVIDDGSGGGGDPLSNLDASLKLRGAVKVTLTWTGGSGTLVEIYRGTDLIARVENTGSYVDVLGKVSNVSYTYMVCEIDKTECTDPLTVTIP